MELILFLFYFPLRSKCGWTAFGEYSIPSVPNCMCVFVCGTKIGSRLYEKSTCLQFKDSNPNVQCIANILQCLPNLYSKPI